MSGDERRPKTEIGAIALPAAQRRSRNMTPSILSLCALGLAGLAAFAPRAAAADPDVPPSRIEVCEAAQFLARVFEDGDDFQTRIAVPEPGLLCVDGGVTDAFADWYAPRAGDFDVVVIRSLGGREAAGVRTGEAALAAGIRLVVWDYCISACANGLVIGAEHVRVPEPAVLAWHGSLPRDRFEAVLLSRGDDPKLRRVQHKLLARFERDGARQVQDAAWEALPERERTLFDERAHWRARVSSLLEARGVHPDFLAASAFAARHAPQETQAYALSRAGSLAPILWVPTPAQLQAWSLDHIETWAAESEAALYELGLSVTPAMVLTSVELEPGEFYAVAPETD